ncbi:MAG TPA: GxxExxY protein [Gemmatimonadales bacterium]|nr:GxxExxY protein [Gemmatimonadales bacterium]
MTTLGEVLKPFSKLGYMEDFPLADLTGQIIGSAIHVHTALGPGLLESAYQACLCHDLEVLGLVIQRRVRVPLVYHGISMNAAYEMDVLVADEVIVEIKAVEKLLPVHQQQLLTYLRLAKKPVGLLINFNVPKLIEGVKRVVNTRGSILQDSK